MHRSLFELHASCSTYVVVTPEPKTYDSLPSPAPIHSPATMTAGARTRIVDEAIDSEVHILSSFGLCRDREGLVSWVATCDDHPRNWAFSRKLYTIIVIVLLELYT